MIGSVDKARADLAQGRVVRRKPAHDHVADCERLVVTRCARDTARHNPPPLSLSMAGHVRAAFMGSSQTDGRNCTETHDTEKAFL